jgi:hypothetical protein
MPELCRECEIGSLKVIGLGGYDDLVQVECRHCGAIYDVEPDGLGRSGDELVEAWAIDGDASLEEDE